MSVKIRLSRTGKKNAPSFRIVATDSRKKRDGRALEILGHYNPSMKDTPFEVNQERLDYWQSVGAQTTEAVEKLLKGEYVYKKYEPKAKEAKKPKSE